MTVLKRQPIIGITLDHEVKDHYSRYPWYALRENYCNAIIDAGGIPIGLPYAPNRVGHYLELINGLMITGGNFDVDPSLYGKSKQHASVKTKDKRTEFELKITQKAHKQNIPTLGICGGLQLMNVALGGTLIQDINDMLPNALEHEQPNPRDQAGHQIFLKSNSNLFKITQRPDMEVNSAHHQAIETIAPDLKINALAPDGVIEGAEDPTHCWFIGVQWHPEFYIDPGDSKIFDSFVNSCQG